MITLEDRAASYATNFPDYPPVHADGRWLTGWWALGQNYRGSGFYGAYPPSYLRRVRALFPEYWHQGRVLHLFSGSLGSTILQIGAQVVRLDVNCALSPDVCGDAHRLPFKKGTFDLVLADPPYSHADAARYGTAMVNRRAVMAETARVTTGGGHLVWLDCSMPMYRKSEWKQWGGIGVQRSTNHRFRGVVLFERI
jgi:hypothetical protein